MSRLVAELEGAELALWVAKADGNKVRIIGAGEYPYSDRETEIFVRRDAEGFLYTPDMGLPRHGYQPREYAPHTDWAQGGPIIEREHIGIAYEGRGDWTAAYDGPTSPHAESAEYESYWGFQRSVNMVDGPTPLIAAMRAFVASKYGAEVPDEVTP